MKKIYFLHLLVLAPLLLFAQARLVLNGATITLQDGASLVIHNSNSNAITLLDATTSGIVTNDATSHVRWYIGTTSDNYSVPFKYSNSLIPLSFSTSGAAGAGFFDLSTYHVPTWKNSDYLPPGVSNVSNNGSDNSNHVLDRFWLMDAKSYSTKPTLTNLSFSYLDAEWNATGNSISEPMLKAQRWNSSLNRWFDYAPSGTADAANSQVVVSTVSSSNLFEWWTLVDANSPLPVQLVSFTAQAVNNASVEVRWSTSSEINTNYFIVERSAAGVHFAPVDTIAAAGSANSSHHYLSNDMLPFDGTSYYRLKMVDKDGSFSYSRVAPVTINTAGIRVYPNPVISTLIIYPGKSGATELWLLDGNGKSVAHQMISGGIHHINVSQLPAGTYVLQLAKGEIKWFYKIVKQ
jgi:hypothetical protein